jgi:hypothetical protein
VRPEVCGSPLRRCQSIPRSPLVQQAAYSVFNNPCCRRM